MAESPADKPATNIKLKICEEQRNLRGFCKAGPARLPPGTGRTFYQYVRYTISQTFP